MDFSTLQIQFRSGSIYISLLLSLSFIFFSFFFFFLEIYLSRRIRSFFFFVDSIEFFSCVGLLILFYTICIASRYGLLSSPFYMIIQCVQQVSSLTYISPIHPRLLSTKNCAIHSSFYYTIYSTPSANSYFRTKKKV